MVSSHVYFLCTSLLMFFKFESFFFAPYGLISLLYVLLLWGKDVCLEGAAGHHNFIVQDGLKLAFLLFVFSEAMFFVSIFWVILDASLCPSIDIGSTWPPFGITPVDFIGLPLFSTVLLLSSGVSLSWSHAQLLSNVRASYTLFLTLVLAVLFLFTQVFEYYSSSLSMSDGIYGSVFYFSTGFHGFHVLLGALFLFYNLVRLTHNHFSSVHHLGLECAIIYWHFVDVVWLLLYLVLYVWGS